MKCIVPREKWKDWSWSCPSGYSSKTQGFLTACCPDGFNLPDAVDKNAQVINIKLIVLVENVQLVIMQKIFPEFVENQVYAHQVTKLYLDLSLELEMFAGNKVINNKVIIN